MQEARPVTQLDNLIFYLLLPVFVTLHAKHYIMARGPSGRCVIEMDPALKRELHAALTADRQTLKAWFQKQAQAYLSERQNPSLPGLDPTPNGGVRRSNGSRNPYPGNSRSPLPAG